MFNLEHAIATWRHSLAAAGLNPDVIAELEGHLRDEIEEQLRISSDPRAAFEKAIQLLGDVVQFKDEFLTATSVERKTRRAFTRFVCFASAAFIALVNAWTLTLFDLSVGQRLIGACAVAYLLAVPFLLRNLSLTAIHHLRSVVKVGAIFVSLFPIILLLSVSHFVDLQSHPITVLVGWLAVAVVAVSALAIAIHDSNDTGRHPFLDAPFPTSRLQSPHLLEQARAEALNLGHDFIGTEHLLLALLKDDRGENKPRPFNLDYDSVRAEITRLISPNPTPPISTHLPLTPRAAKALKIADTEAKRQKHPLVTIDHILTGLTHEGTGVAAMVLKKFRLR